MTKRLMLMRHAVSPDMIGGIDAERPLSENGARQAAAVGAFLGDQQWLPDFILVSSARRTFQTARLLAEAANIETDSIHILDGLYNASPEKIEQLVRLAEIPKSVMTLLIIAHNPGISRLATECSGKNIPLYFSPAAIAGFEFEESWNDFSSELTRICFYHETGSE